ncbi:MAG TPA: G8 domain-containing protein, partial [Marinobacter sp.]|nr:G8 domain-containing protein [Marinobacter sp.]
MPVMNNAGTHHNHASMMAEHAAFLDLVAYEEATHAAVNDGDWCNPNTWHNLSVPGDNARVVIPSDIEVVYNQVDDSRLHTVRVDGSLVFASNTSSRMIVDTLAVDPRGSLIIGSENNPVSNAAKVEIIIADNGDIDVDWDPLLLSRGLILHGTTQIHGATKTAHGKVAVDPRAGDITLQMSRSPSNWRVG